MPTLRLAVSLAAVAVAVAAPAASAAPQAAAISVFPSAGPVLSGDEVVWAAPSSRGLDLFRSRAGQTPRRVSRVYTDPSDEELDSEGGVTTFAMGGLAGAPGIVGLWVSSSFDKYRLYGDYLYAQPIGPLSDPVVATQGDEFNGPACARYNAAEVDVTSDAVVFASRTQSGLSCPAGLRPHVRLLTLPKSGDSQDIDTGDALAVGQVRIAGRWVAWRQAVADGVETVVYDRSAGAVSYRVPGGARSLDVDDEGRVVVLHDDGSVTWHSPVEPGAHGVALDGAGRVAIGGGRIGYARAVDDGTRIGSIALGAGSQPRDGTTVPGAPDKARWDYDGERLAWLQPSCLGATIYVEADVGAAGTPVATPECRVELLSSVLRPDRDRYLTVRVRCRNGCDGRLTLTAPRLFAGRRRAELTASGRDVAELRLKRAEVRRLARLGTVRGRLVAQPTAPRPGREYARTVTLRPR